MTETRTQLDDGARGVLVILSSPSGAGKTTLAGRLMAEFPDIAFSVSYTTRARRGAEQHGRDYYFVDDATFDRMIEDGAFAEWAVVHGNRYGTTRESVELALSGGQIVMFDIDWQGGKTIGEQWPDDALKVFVLPPDLEVLEQRLRKRATDDDAVIRRRLARAVEETAHYREYDYLVVNDELERAYAALRAIFLVRRYGAHDRADVAFPLSELAARVHADREPAREHAARLVAGSS